MTERQLREREVQIARYQFLSREVTDPLAAYLLRVIIVDLEDELRRNIDNRAAQSWSLQAPRRIASEFLFWADSSSDAAVR